MTLRNFGKDIVEAALSSSGIPAISRRRHRGKVLILAYHNVVPHGQSVVGDLSLHIRHNQFVAHLDRLTRTHDVVALHDVLAGTPPSTGRPRAVLTFDDAYHGAVTVGLAELAARGLPATMFVAPSFLGGEVFWWDALSTAEGLSPETRAAVLTECTGSTEKAREWARRRGLAWNDALPDHARCASLAELERASSAPDIEIGSHTWSHQNLERLDDGELRAELAKPRAWLEGRFPRVSSALSYPYGLRSAGAESMAREVGYTAALRSEGGLMSAAPGEFAVPRVNIPAGMSPRGLGLRAAGLLCR